MTARGIAAQTRSSAATGQIIIAHNPRAGARSRAEVVRYLGKRLASEGWPVELIEDLKQVSELARGHLTRGRLRAVVVAGGDGTVAAVANCTPIGTPLVVYPLGTENLVAKYLGYVQRPEAVAELLSSGQEVAMDAGVANGRLFVLMISAGFDAEVVRQVAVRRAGHIRRWTYAKPLLATMRSYRYPEMRIDWKGPADAADPEGSRAEGTATVRWAFGMNLSKYAFGLNFAPDASGTDGLLDVCTFTGSTVLHVFRYAWGVFLRRHLRYRDTRMIRCSEMRIEGPRGIEVPYQLDGDFGAYLPVDVRVLTGRLRFLLSADMAERLTST